ncbi:MAG: putative histidine kinase [Marine Group I thaumarchaeote]|nr:MAG: putative histidine kinase [Marine Group I thaumarchaeote]
MKIGIKLTVGFLIVISFVVLIGTISYFNTDSLGKNFEFLVEHDLNVLQNAQKLQKLVVDAETGQRGFVITGDEDFLAPYYNGVNEFNELIEVEKKLVSDNPPQVQRLERINELFEEWQAKAAIPEIEMARTVNSDVAALLQAGTGKSILDQIRDEFTEFIRTENELKDQRFATALDLESNTKNTAILVTSFSIGIGLATAFYISRTISRPVKKLEDAANQISKGNLDVKLENKGTDEIGVLSRTFEYMAKSVRKSQEIMKQADIQKEEFASMVTHELKTPLTPIITYCDLLREPKLGHLNSEQLESVNEIEKSAHRLERLIADVLDAQKLDMERMRFEKKRFGVGEFMNKIQKDLFPLMKDKKIEFVNNTPEKVSLTSDDQRIRQVMNNLIRNSVDFVPQEKGKIEIGAKSEDHQVIFYVKDNGIGIPKEKHPHLFQKFYQIDTSHRRKHGGTGLGLVICKGITEALGGRIWLESDAGKGATFYFGIPKDEEKIKVRSYK